jgi:hypothetical protein
MNGKKVLVCLGLILTLAACGSNAEQDRAPESYSGESANALVQPAAAEDESGRVDDNQPALIAAARPVAQETGADRMIIKNGQLSLLVDDPSEALNQVTVLATEYGGYVISSAANNTGSPKTAAITIAVDAVQFEASMNALRAVGSEVLQDSATGQDVTAEYVDLESRLRGLEATRERILSFLDRAQNAEEALNVNAQLTEVEGQIEQVKGRMNYLEGRAAYSTITIYLREEVPPVKDKEPDKWSPRQTLEDAIDAQVELVEFLSKATIWIVIVLGPYLLIAGIILLVARRWFVRRRRVSQG